MPLRKNSLGNKRKRRETSDQSVDSIQTKKLRNRSSSFLNKSNNNKKQTLSSKNSSLGRKNSLRKTEYQKLGQENIDVKENSRTQNQAYEQRLDTFLHSLKEGHSFKIKNATLLSVVQPYNPTSINIVHQQQQIMLGSRYLPTYIKSIQKPVENIVSDLQLYRTASPFDRRCTALEWDPTHPRRLAIGSKSGDIILWTIDAIKNEVFIPGKGPGGSIQAMRFDPFNPDWLITASIDGTITAYDFVTKQRRILLSTLDFYRSWYCSLDIHKSTKTVIIGENTGLIHMIDLEGNELWEKKLHKAKVTNLEYSPAEPWLLCSSSVDNTVKLWDIRMIKDKTSFLCSLQHDKAVNSAYFSQTDGTRLLTTDQHHDLRIYRAPLFHLEKNISHPHRFFQHLTPIKAHWHPLVDLIVIGRYPDSNMLGYQEDELRTVDFIDAGTGEIVSQISDPGHKGLISLNKFNSRGDCLASTMGQNILVWNRKEFIADKQASLMKAMRRSGIHPAMDDQSPIQNGRQSGKSKKLKTEENKKARQKLQVKTTTKTKQKKN